MRFSSLQQLMTFAFGMRSAVSLSAIYKMRREKKSQHAETVTPIDVLTQRGMIKSYVWRQDPIEKYHLIATFSRGHERIDAQNKIRDWILPRLPTDAHNRRMMYELVAKFYGKAVDVRAVAEHLNVDALAVAENWSNVKRILSGVRYRVDGETQHHYSSAGMIAE